MSPVIKLRSEPSKRFTLSVYVAVIRNPDPESTMPTIPLTFHTPDSQFTVSKGLIAVVRGRLVIEWETKDAILGVHSSGVQQVEVAPDDVSAVRFKSNLFVTEIAMRVNSMKRLEQVPGINQGEIRLRFKRKYKVEAEKMAVFLDNRLRELDSIEEPETPSLEP